MSIGTIIGFIIGIGLFIYAIINGGASNPLVFIHPNSFFMVIGGTIAATFIAYKENYVIQALSGMFKIFKHLDINSKTLYEDVGKIIGWAEIVKKGGIQELQNKFDANENKNPVVKYSMEMVLSAGKSEEIYRLTEDFIESTHDRRTHQVDILDTMATFSPAFGMVGTLIGLVFMLFNMGGSGGIDSIGPAMGVALITTFYGSVLANLMFNPFSEKLQARNKENSQAHQLMIHGILMIWQKKHQIEVKDMLTAYIPPEERKQFADAN